jgi:hypothetical protein
MSHAGRWPRRRRRIVSESAEPIPVFAAIMPIGDGGRLRRLPGLVAGRVEQGPGAILSMWSATMGGVLRIYIDGAVQPALAEDFTAVAGNFDLPIPFREHVKVTLEGNGPAYFYQVEYRKYVSACIDVTSCQAADVDTTKLDAVRALLMNPSIPESGATIENTTLTAQNPALVEPSLCSVVVGKWRLRF